MNPSVIDGIRWAARGYESHELQALTQSRPAKSQDEPDKLEQLLKSIGVSTEMENQIMEEVLNRGTDSETRGFRNGFRLAVRLMTECLANPEAPETGGGA